MKEQVRKIFEEAGFDISNCDDGYELEDWTNGGVDMIIELKRGQEKEDFINYVENFDIDEEIDLYRQDKRYCDAFTCRESVEDFEKWEEMIKAVKERLLKEAK